MKKIMIAALGLSLLSGSVVFAQNTASTDSSAKKTHHKKGKKSTKSDAGTTGAAK